MFSYLKFGRIFFGDPLIGSRQFFISFQECFTQLSCQDEILLFLSQLTVDINWFRAGCSLGEWIIIGDRSDWHVSLFKLNNVVFEMRCWAVGGRISLFTDKRSRSGWRSSHHFAQQAPKSVSNQSVFSNGKIYFFLFFLSFLWKTWKLHLHSRDEDELEKLVER